MKEVKSVHWGTRLLAYPHLVFHGFRLDSIADTKTVTAAPALDADGQKRTEPDLAAKVAALERQNRELAAKVAAMEEEDARMEAAYGSSTWEPSGGGTRLA